MCGVVFSVLQSMSDPIRTLRRRFWLTAAVGVVALTACGVWALAPISARWDVAEYVSTQDDGTPAAEQISTRGIERSNFLRPIWNPKPLPAPPPRATAPKREQRAAARAARPPQLKLVGIRPSTGGAVAVIYEEKTDRLHFTEKGDAIGESGYSVVAIADGEVEIGNGASVHHLKVRDEDPQR